MAPKITFDRPASAGCDGFPVIDLANYLAGAPDALDNVGFLVVVNHWVGIDLLDGIVEQTRRFHALPFAEKEALGTDRGNGNGFTGYLASGGYSVRTSEINENTKPDLNAAFFMDRERPLDDPEVLAGKLFREPNEWPANLPSFREFLLGYWDTLEAFSRRLLPAFAVSLDLPPTHFARAFDDAQCVLRLSHFRAMLYQDNQLGLAPHTDANFFTVLPQAIVEGLYIRPRGRGWTKAPRIAGSLIINSGDMCRRWTKDRFLSTAHLVVNLSGRDRYSTPFFYTPHIDQPIVCLPTCCNDDSPAKYPPITYGEYRNWRLDNNYRTKLEEA